MEDANERCSDTTNTFMSGFSLVNLFNVLSGKENKTGEMVFHVIYMYMENGGRMGSKS